MDHISGDDSLGVSESYAYQSQESSPGYSSEDIDISRPTNMAYFHDLEASIDGEVTDVDAVMASAPPHPSKQVFSELDPPSDEKMTTTEDDLSLSRFHQSSTDPGHQGVDSLKTDNFSASILAASSTLTGAPKSTHYQHIRSQQTNFQDSLQRQQEAWSRTNLYHPVVATPNHNRHPSKTFTPSPLPPKPSENIGTSDYQELYESLQNVLSNLAKREEEVTRLQQENKRLQDELATVSAPKPESDPFTLHEQKSMHFQFRGLNLANGRPHSVQLPARREKSPVPTHVRGVSAIPELFESFHEDTGATTSTPTKNSTTKYSPRRCQLGIQTTPRESVDAANSPFKVVDASSSPMKVDQGPILSSIIKECDHQQDLEKLREEILQLKRQLGDPSTGLTMFDIPKELHDEYVNRHIADVDNLTRVQLANDVKTAMLEFLHCDDPITFCKQTRIHARLFRVMHAFCESIYAEYVPGQSDTLVEAIKSQDVDSFMAAFAQMARVFKLEGFASIMGQQ